MMPRPFALRFIAFALTALSATVAVAEDMSLPSPSADCLSRATFQLSLDTARCAGSYPVTSTLYGQCIVQAQRAYVDAQLFCIRISGARGAALRAGVTPRVTTPTRK